MRNELIQAFRDAGWQFYKGVLVAKVIDVSANLRVLCVVVDSDGTITVLEKGNMAAGPLLLISDQPNTPIDDTLDYFHLCLERVWPMRYGGRLARTPHKTRSR